MFNKETQNYSTNSTKEAGLKAIDSLKKAREEFGSLNAQSTLLALAYKSEAAAISEKQLALEKVIPYLKQAEKDLNHYLELAYKTNNNATFSYINELCDTVLNQANDLESVIKAMNEINKAIEESIGMVDFSLILFSSLSNKRRKT